MVPTLSLKDALSPLKESSKSAIADADCESFDKITEYLHLDRVIEGQLKEFLESVKKSDSKKLFLVCGNVGDGKSHLLASVRLNNPELLKDVVLHNDATESSDPKASFIDELNNLLEPFTDSNIETGNEKIVLAINLGTLNNFLAASRNENNFTKLQAFVTENKILDTGDIVECQFLPDSPFQFVNFCDHNLFHLTPEGPVSEIIETALERVVSSEGPFFEAYKTQKEKCSDKCPICFNFEALQLPTIRKSISSLLIECIVRGEIIISIRALYNFIYEILVPIDLEDVSNTVAAKRIEKYSDTDFLKNILPNYIFSHPELSNIFEQIQIYDPASQRDEIIDNAIIDLMISDSPVRLVEQHVDLDSVGNNLARIFQKVSSGKEYINSFIRSSFFWPKSRDFLRYNSSYDAFMKMLFEWYSGNSKSLKSLYQLVGHAITSWNGQTSAGKININIGRQQLEYRISEKINLKPAPLSAPQATGGGVYTFNSSIPLQYHENGEDIHLFVTYNLFSLIQKINDGYRPTVLDHSNFVVFDDFVKSIATAGEGQNQVFFTESKNRRQFVLELDSFGDFCFEEVER